MAERTVIPYRRDLQIANTQQLARGTGCRYLVCITSHREGELIAKRWARRATCDAAEVLVDLGGRK